MRDRISCGALLKNKLVKERSVRQADGQHSMLESVSIEFERNAVDGRIVELL